MSNGKKNKTNKDGFRILHIPSDRYKVQYLCEGYRSFFTVTEKYRDINEAIQEASLMLKSLEAPALSEEESLVFERKLDVFFENIYVAGYENEPGEDENEIEIDMLFDTLHDERFISKGIIFLEPPNKVESESGNFFSFASDADLFVTETKCKRFPHAMFLDESIYIRIMETPITQQYPIVEFNIKTAF